MVLKHFSKLAFKVGSALDNCVPFHCPSLMHVNYEGYFIWSMTKVIGNYCCWVEKLYKWLMVSIYHRRSIQARQKYFSENEVFITGMFMFVCDVLSV